MKLKKIPFVLLLLPLVAAIIIWNHFHTDQQENADLRYSTVWQTQLTGVPQVRDKNVKTEAILIWRKDTTGVVLCDEKVILYIKRDSLSIQLCQGDSLLIYGRLTHANRGNPYEFDYDGWLKEHDIIGTMFVDSNCWLKNGHSTIITPTALAEKCRRWFVDKLRECGLHEEELGVAAAMVVGDRYELQSDLREKYSAVGAMHVLAVSGLHTGIVFGAVMFLLTGFGLYPVLYKQRKRKLIISIVGISIIWLYACLTGMSPSVRRAALMLTMLYIGFVMNRKQVTLNTLAATAFFNLLIEPQALFSVSFQLSYAAVLGILLFYDKLYSVINFRNMILNRIWQLTVISIAVQLLTLPVNLWYFQQTNNYFVFTNIFIIPLSIVIIYSSALFACLAATPLGIYVSYIVRYLIMFMNLIVNFIEKLPASTTNLSITYTILFTIILSVLFLTLWIHRKKWQWLAGVVLMFILTLLFHILHLKQIEQTTITFVYNTYPYTLIVHQNGRSCTIYTDDKESALKTTEPLRKQMMISSVRVVDFMDEEVFAFQCGGKRYLCLTPAEHHKIDFHNTSEHNLISCDVLLLGGKGRLDHVALIQKIQPKQIVLLSSLPNWKYAPIPIERVATLSNIKIEDTKQSAIEIK